MDGLPRDVQIFIVSLCDMDGRRKCGVAPGKLRVPLHLQQNLDALLVKQRRYVSKWEAACNHLRAGLENFYILEYLALTDHYVARTKPW